MGVLLLGLGRGVGGGRGGLGGIIDRFHRPAQPAGQGLGCGQRRPTVAGLDPVVRGVLKADLGGSKMPGKIAAMRSHRKTKDRSAGGRWAAHAATLIASLAVDNNKGACSYGRVTTTPEVLMSDDLPTLDPRDLTPTEIWICFLRSRLGFSEAEIPATLRTH